MEHYVGILTAVTPKHNTIQVGMHRLRLLPHDFTALMRVAKVGDRLEVTFDEGKEVQAIAKRTRQL